jgi:hypothetical protein
MLLAHFIGDARPRQPDELGERRVRPAQAARQRGNKACHRGVVVTVEGAQIDRVDRSARRAAYPQEPIARLMAAPIVGEKIMGARSQLE